MKQIIELLLFVAMAFLFGVLVGFEITHNEFKRIGSTINTQLDTAMYNWSSDKKELYRCHQELVNQVTGEM